MQVNKTILLKTQILNNAFSCVNGIYRVSVSSNKYYEIPTEKSNDLVSINHSIQLNFVVFSIKRKYNAFTFPLFTRFEIYYWFNGILGFFDFAVSLIFFGFLWHLKNVVCEVILGVFLNGTSAIPKKQQ